ncbi:MAG: hypothetical protein F6K47_36330 [Symploca sp. SIO2E6]|nr:hypothetical protein [Symploca sp. SIO2E6]
MLKLRRPKKVILISSSIFLMRLIGYLPPILVMGVVGYLSSILLFGLMGYLFPVLPMTQQTSPAASPLASSATSPESTIKQVTQLSAPPQLPQPMGRNGAGLGDTRANFDSVHGFNLGDDQSGRYKNNYINVAYDDGVAYYISLLFEQTNHSQRTQNEALALAMSFMPADSVKIKELPAREDVYLVYFESQKLADSVPEKWHKDFWEGIKPGSFLLILNHEKENPNAAFAVTVAAGNSVPFLSR